MLLNRLETPNSGISSVLNKEAPESTLNLTIQEIDSSIYLTALYLFRASQLINPIESSLAKSLLSHSDKLLEVIEKEPLDLKVSINEEEINFIKETIKNAI